MRLTITEIPGGKFLPGNTFTFPHKDADGAVHTIELTHSAQTQLVFQLLSAEIGKGETTKPRLILQPKGVRASPTSLGQIGLMFQLTESAGIHLILDPQSAQLVIRAIETALANVKPVQKQ